MVSSQQDGEYLSFDEYNDYKSKLNDSYTFIHEEDEYETFFRTAMPKKYLQNFISDESCSYGKCCSYMNYWLNKKMQESKESLNESDFYIYNDYIEYYNGRTDEKVCKSNKFFIGTYEYKEMKTLYSLYELYNTFKTNSSNIDKGCRELSSCVMYYNNIVRKCKQKNNSGFCKALQNFKTIYAPDKFISLRKCEEKLGELKLKEPGELSEEVTETVNLSLLQWRRGSAETGLFEDSFFSEPRGNKEGEEESINVSSFSHSNLIQTLFSSAFGISILFLLSYKFTPFGKWMRSALLRKNINTHYETEEDTQDILSHTYENTNIDTEDSIHNIQYYATQNS
ncbi:Plasmodium vivax Vir protein, putative [Plasmodium ovale]|uniref:Plasmodium vivax Vir protein, putative n=1 Tax=Plasmodium ovale TaxID=36330 RepID=A0A1C3KK81_PLAOA|nr:Plasmodium vivax Vir protein, putative [Plasmodium ovale]